jgi:hypothetical protein
MSERHWFYCDTQFRQVGFRQVGFRQVGFRHVDLRQVDNRLKIKILYSKCHLDIRTFEKFPSCLLKKA